MSGECVSAGLQGEVMSESHHGAAPRGSSSGVLVGLGVVLAGYLVAAALGWPQWGTEQSLHHGDSHAEAIHPHPAYYSVACFVLLLGAIAVLPLVHATAHWWEHNRNKFLVASVLGLLTLLYYATLYGQPIESHFLGGGVVEPAAGFSWPTAWTVLQNAILVEYIPFIVLLFSLYTICGGIRIEGDLRAHPRTNTTFLGVGTLLASFIGTTGAAMLLIRPLLETNSERKHVKHTVVFFIFTVCNCGGLLLPIGDPPLFLGYLKGVDFLWTLSMWREWIFVNGALLAVYFLVDTFWFYPQEQKLDVLRDETRVRKLQVRGLWPNAPLLLGVVLAVALLDPSKPLPGTDWHAWLYLRETVQLGLVALSLGLGSAEVRQQNRFTYGAIIEVAALFVGIFICMQPALQLLHVHGASLGIDTPHKFFWATGSLSSVLDNAPTYLVFFETAQSLHSDGATMAGVAVELLAAISLGAVMMGAMTYIGNGPNFMVKTIAEVSGVKMPSFFGYMGYSFAFLLPLFFAMTWLFL